MVTTVFDLIEDTRNLLYGPTRQEVNRLAAAVNNSSDTTITFEFDLQGITQKSYISVNDEIMYVFSTNTSAKTAVVQRAFLGTSKGTHAIGDMVEVNARFPRAKIKRALLQSINALPPRLFQVDASDITVGTTTFAYALPDDTYLSIIDVVRKPYAGSTSYPAVIDWYDVRNQPVANFANGAGIIFRSSFLAATSLRIRFARKFVTTTFADATDVNATIGLAESMNDIPPIDAAFRLMGTKEVIRTALSSQPEPRSAEEVPPGHIGSVASQLRKIRDDRISEEMMSLRERYPIKGW